MFVYQEPNKHAGVIGFINNLLGGVAQRQAEQQDMELINQIRSGGAITKLPSTPEMRKFALDLMNPKTQAEVENLMAEAGLFEAGTQERKRPPVTASQAQIAQQGDSTGLEPGTVYQYDAQGNMKVINRPSRYTQVKLAKEGDGTGLIPGTPYQYNAEGQMVLPNKSMMEANVTTNVDARPMTEGQIQRRVNRETLINTATKIRENWKPEYTGPIDSRIQHLKTVLWGDRANAKWSASVASLIQTMYDRAGKQLSDKEMERWQPFIPKETMPDESFQGQVDNLVENVADYLTNEEAVLRQAGYQTGAGGASQAESPIGISAPTVTDKDISSLLANAPSKVASQLKSEWANARKATGGYSRDGFYKYAKNFIAGSKVNMKPIDTALNEGNITQEEYDTIIKALQANPANYQAIIKKLQQLKPKASKS